MGPLAYSLTLAHLTGLVLCVGGATVKAVLLLRAGTNAGRVRDYLGVVRPITRQLLTGMALLTVSGVGWLLLKYPFSPLLTFKLVLVAIGWVLGGTIDRVAEPAFRATSPAVGEVPSPEFLRARSRYLLLELAATSSFYLIIATWLLH